MALTALTAISRLIARFASSSVENEKDLKVGKHPSPVTEDFVGLFHQQGLDHLTQKIMFMLISPEDEDCSLTEAKLVSSMWRETVDNLVLDTNKYTLTVKRVMRRAVSKYAEWSAALGSAPCPCPKFVVRTLQELEEPGALLEIFSPVLTEIYMSFHEVYCAIDSLQAHEGTGQDLEKALAWKNKILRSGTQASGSSGSLWMRGIFPGTTEKPVNPWTRAVRAVLVYRLFLVKSEEATVSAE